MSPRRAPGPRVLLVAVLLLTGLLAGCSIEDAAPAADGLSRSGPAASSAGPTGTATGSTTATPSDPVPDEPPTALFLGDSYTVGIGASSPEAGYVQRTAALLGWRAVTQGQGGTGYVNPSDDTGQSVYGGRLAEVAAAQPDIVVVQGSTNDVGRPWESVEAAATELYRGLRTAVPTARVVVLGPLAPPGVDPVAVGDIRNAVARAAFAAGVPFIDPIAAGWLLPVDGLYADPVHPDDDGYRELGEDLALALRTIGF
ncbi:SGNH/GDSL hydrolase family protein [Modestobacter sp. URMC 112]